MIEPGILSQSFSRFFTPSQTIKQLYYHLTYCGHYFCHAEYSVKRDYFPYLLLVYVRNGHFHVHYRDKSVIAQKGDIFLIDCREPHHYHASEGLEFLFIHFDGPHSRELCHYIMKQHGFFFQSRRNIETGKQLYDLIDTYRHGKELSMAEVAVIIYSMINSLSALPDSEPDEQTIIDKAIEYMKHNMNRQITLKEIAQHVNLSPYYFSHLFKSETGFAPIEFVTKHRIDTAKKLLKTTALPVSDIAYEVGYSSSSGFINIFVKKTGCSPTEFRQLQL